MMKRTLYPLVALLLLVSIAFGATLSYAGGEESVPIRDAEVIIKECWDLSLELRSSQNTNSIRAGHLETALCLEKAIVDHASVFIDPEYMTRQQIEEKIEQIHNAAGKFYWSLYNQNNPCTLKSCGTMWHVFHNLRTAQLFEEVLRNVIRHRKQYDQ